MAKKRPTRIKSTEKTIRKNVPISIIRIKDVYKSKLEGKVKDKHKNSISDKVIFELFVKALEDMPDKIFFDNVPKKYMKNKN